MSAKLAVLVSGNGSNLQAILDACAEGTLCARVAVVISNCSDAYALDRARRAGVEALCLPSKGRPRLEYDRDLAREIRFREADLVVLAGFMRILTPDFISAFNGRIVNIHPALLPRYPGLDAIRRAFEAGEREVGVTVHLVDEGVDTGCILAQETVVVLRGDTIEALEERIHAVEHRLYPEVIRRLLENLG